MCMAWHGIAHVLIAHSITSDATKVERFVVLQTEFTPIICESVVTPKALPSQFVVTSRLLASASETELHLPHVLGDNAIGLNMHISFDFL